MTSILDRYILKSFLFSYFVCLLTLLALYTIMDFFQQVEDLFKNTGAADSYPLYVFANYYLSRYLMIFGQINPFTLLMGAMFTISWLDRYNELTAMKASGVSLHRCLRPIVAAALAIIAAQVLVQEWVLPRWGPQIEDNIKQVRRSKTEKGLPLNTVLVDRRGCRFCFRLYLAAQEELQEVYVSRLFAGQALKEQELCAARAVWRRLGDRWGWLCTSGTLVSYDPEDRRRRQAEVRIPAAGEGLLLVLDEGLGWEARPAPPGAGGAFLESSLSPQRVEESQWQATNLL